MLVPSDSFPSPQNPRFPPQLYEHSFTSWMVKLVIVVLDEELCDFVLWIEDDWVEGLNSNGRSVAQPATDLDELCSIVELWAKRDDTTAA